MVVKLLIVRLPRCIRRLLTSQSKGAFKKHGHCVAFCLSGNGHQHCPYGLPLNGPLEIFFLPSAHNLPLSIRLVAYPCWFILCCCERSMAEHPVLRFGQGSLQVKETLLTDGNFLY